LFKADDHKDALEDIADTASKEFSNEKILNQMFADWEPLEFTPSVQKDTYKLGGDSIELIQQTLDDHLVKTQTMKGSPFAKYFLDTIVKWEDQLMKTLDNVDMWLKVQAVWMYLEPVFSSEDIMKQMPVEGNKFREVDKDWRMLMKQVAEDPSALNVIKIPGLHDIVFNAYAKLEEVQKGLNAYLESKRGLFPRFFFLSDPELLEILSETKDPLKIQPYLKKCFEAIEELEFDDECKIHAMKSSEGERIQYVKIIDPVLAKGNVEEWLKPVEEVMIKSVKDVIDKSNLDYTKPGQEREKWVTIWPGQAVLAVSMMKWTSQAEEAMKKSGLAGLEVFFEKQNKQVSTNISRFWMKA
jgi:dynein heavy chain, axonemal